MTTYDADVLERIVHEALKERDMPGVVAALKLLAVTDAQRATDLLDLIQAGIAVARSTWDEETA